MNISHTTLIAALLRYASNLRFKQLFLLTSALFILDLLIPDMVPFVDEILLGLLTIWFGSWRKKPNKLRGSNSGFAEKSESDQHVNN